MIDIVKSHFSNPEILWGILLLSYSSIISYIGLLGLKSAPDSWSKRLLYVPSEKSKTNAILLGGLPLNILLMFSIGYIIHKHPKSITYSEIRVMQIFIFVLAGALFYGHFDDRFEVRPLVKLIFQFAINTVLALIISRHFYPENSAVAFILIVLLTTAIMNGNNLLDGIDSLAAKIAMNNCIYFFIVGAYTLAFSASFIALGTFSLVFSFYLFNRAPAKIYLGEIGAVTLGLCNVIMGMEIFLHFKIEQIGGTARGFAYAIIPSTLAIIELAISFSRRFLIQKSPFRGDKLHLHYLIQNRFQLSAGLTSSLMATFHLAGLILGVVAINNLTITTGLILQCLFYIIPYISIGYKEWFKDQKILNPQYLHVLIVKEKENQNQNVHALPSQLADKEKEKDKSKKKAA